MQKRYTMVSGPVKSEFIESDVGKNAINQLKQVLGRVRKTENNIETRVYYKREIKTLENPAFEKQIKKLIYKRKK